VRGPLLLLIEMELNKRETGWKTVVHQTNRRTKIICIFIACLEVRTKLPTKIVVGNQIIAN
jgi:hypothetical protein